MFYYENRLKVKGYDLIIGVDEAGRGPLAGPVVAAAVILKARRFKNRIDDSKKLTPLAREKAFLELSRKSVFGIGIMNEKVIDRVNILEATRLAMEQAVVSLLEKTGFSKTGRMHIITDGRITLGIPLPCKGIIGGDRKSKTIAGASIFAKVIRDRIMKIYARAFPQYGFQRHKGYGTQEHIERLKKLGPSPIHRQSFHVD
ncbi:MAG: ribonuclease HII [Candidatus Omnitrophica bacterium]|nr:ribonuclease HII [Candidatus Omnitrophota bacterium]MBL7151387.1 ribonuclease HII [Candidatus Omnitrophota bacterium]MBL7210258.1 ribonuclease HII [Candidatus Omnitrophota bacterium]